MTTVPAWWMRKLQRRSLWVTSPKSPSWEVKDSGFKSNLPNSRDFSLQPSVKCEPLKYSRGFYWDIQKTNAALGCMGDIIFQRLKNTNIVSQNTVHLHSLESIRMFILSPWRLWFSKFWRDWGTVVSLCPSDDFYGLVGLGSMHITGKLVCELGFLYSVSDSQHDLWQVIRTSRAAASLPVKVGH